MQDSTWTRALLELVESVLASFVRFWKQDMVQVFLAIGMFFALAIPLLIVILVLWYIDSTGWRPTGGFYKIGLSENSVAFEAKMCATSLVSGRRDVPIPISGQAGLHSNGIGVESIRMRVV